MEKHQEPSETLREIRSMMERSSRFSSLSGLSGVVAGLAAIAGVVAGCSYLGISPLEPGYYRFISEADGNGFFTFAAIDLALVFLIALIPAFLLTRNKARQHGRPAWDASARRLLTNLLIPLIAGAIYCLLLVQHGQIALVAPATLIFYGMALLNAGKYTLNDVRYLGIGQLATGLAATGWPDYGLLFWIFGFGLLHLVYGIAMYFKYEK